MSNRIRRGVLLWICGALLSLRAAATGPTQNLYSPHPPVTNLVEGISWPKGQALPTFARPAPVLDSIEVQALTGDEQITFSALQGQVNRKQPRIYLLDARAVVKDNTSDVTDVDLEPVKARSLKIIITGPGADSTARISDVEIFGKKAR